MSHKISASTWSSQEPRLRVVALLTVRNEELYLDRCLKHLISHGIEVCVIDNDSNDRTVEIARQYFGKGVCRIETIGFNGKFELERILENEERLSREINADWFMHHDADEIREPPLHYNSLLEAITDVDRQGYNAVNFDEFVFVPTPDQPDVIPSDYVSEMKYYYFYEPVLQRRVNLWKSGPQKVDLRSSAGHRVKFPGRQIFPESFILRHYIALSASHWNAKYATRKYPEQELARGWHVNRTDLKQYKIRMPAREDLVRLSSDNRIRDKGRPRRYHPILETTGTLKKRIRNFLRRLLQRLIMFFQRK